LLGPRPRRLQHAVVDHQHLHLAAALQLIQFRHDALTRLAAAHGEDQQDAPAGEVVQGDLAAGDAGQGEIGRLLAGFEAAAAEPVRRGRLQLLQALAQQPQSAQSAQEQKAQEQDHQ
jgi:hypothetical protein